MGWDFSTDPELQGDLDWIRHYADDVILPLEIAGEGLGQRAAAIRADHGRAGALHE